MRERITAVADGAEVREGDEAGRSGHSRHRGRDPTNELLSPSRVTRPDVPVGLTCARLHDGILPPT